MSIIYRVLEMGLRIDLREGDIRAETWIRVGARHTNTWNREPPAKRAAKAEAWDGNRVSFFEGQKRRPAWPQLREEGRKCERRAGPRSHRAWKAIVRNWILSEDDWKPPGGWEREQDTVHALLWRMALAVGQRIDWTCWEEQRGRELFLCAFPVSLLQLG